MAILIFDDCTSSFKQWSVMSRTRFNLLFYLKKPKKYEEGDLMPICMRIGVGKQTEFATQG
jgi:hypothetical protein